MCEKGWRLNHDAGQIVFFYTNTDAEWRLELFSTQLSQVSPAFCSEPAAYGAATPAPNAQTNTRSEAAGEEGRRNSAVFKKQEKWTRED